MSPPASLTIFSKVNTYVRDQDIFTPGQRLIAAVSGGMDSMMLLEYLYKNRALLGIDLRVLHIDHGLHPLSDRHARFVAQQARRRGIPALIERVVWPGGRIPASDIEQKAREERLTIFRRVAKRWRADIATAHHKNDQAETVLMRLLRGTGLKGLASMRPVSVHGDMRVMRPFLCLTKEEIKQAAAALKIAHRNDPTNRNPRLLRNRLRRLMVKLRRQINPSLDEALCRLADQAGEDDDALQQWARTVFTSVPMSRTGHRLTIPCEMLAALPAAVIKRLFCLAYEQIAGHRRRLEARHLEALLGLMNRPDGCEKLPSRVVVEKKRNNLIWRQKIGV